MEYSKWAEQTVSGALDTDGKFFPLDSLAQTFARDGAGNILSIVASDGTNTWTQTFTYKNGLVSAISGWVKA